MKNFVTHLVMFLLGIAIAAGLLFNYSEQTPVLDSNNDFPMEQQNRLTATEIKPLPTDASIGDKDRLIEQQAKELERLSREIHAIREELNASLMVAKTQQAAEDSNEEESEAKLRTMNMKTFEESMKTQFTDQFKGVVLQLEGQRLEDIKQSFNNSSEKNEWSNQYENSIANFLATNDENGDHYLQSLNCNTNVCRLEVNTNDADNWNSLYAKMTNEPWYQSITVQEESDYPGNVIYYLPSLNN